MADRILIDGDELDVLLLDADLPDELLVEEDDTPLITESLLLDSDLLDLLLLRSGAGDVLLLKTGTPAVIPVSPQVKLPAPLGGTWDPAVLGTLLLDGYGQTQPSGNLRSEEVWSEPYYKRIVSNRPIQLRVYVRQTREQRAAWESFWENDLAYGNKWFLINLDNSGFSEAFTVHLESWTAAPRPDTVQSFTRLELNLEALLADPVA